MRDCLACCLPGGGERPNQRGNRIGRRERFPAAYTALELGGEKGAKHHGVKTYSRKADGAKALTPNLKVQEFACRDGSDVILISEELVTLLQKIRDHFGRSMEICSGYRTEAYNKKIGGAAKSQHMLGMAADIAIAGISPLAVAQYAEFLQPASGGIGVYSTFTHVDVRAGRARWDNRSGAPKPVEGWGGYAEKSSETDQAVEWITKAGILKGNGDGDLLLDEPLTARRFAVLLYRYDRQRKNG